MFCGFPCLSLKCLNVLIINLSRQFAPLLGGLNEIYFADFSGSVFCSQNILVKNGNDDMSTLHKIQAGPLVKVCAAISISAHLENLVPLFTYEGCIDLRTCRALAPP